MLENLFTNVFGRPKSKTSNKNTPNDQAGISNQPSGSDMTGPFSMSPPQMPQPANLPYPAAPYPPAGPTPTANTYYPSLPFCQPPSLPASHGINSIGGSSQPFSYPTGTLAPSQVSPLDSVPFEAKLTLTNSTNLVSLDHLFKEIKKAADVVDRADVYLRSSQSDYDFKIEQGLIYQ